MSNVNPLAHRLAKIVPALLVSLLILSACAGGGPGNGQPGVAYDPVPQTVNTAAQHATTTDLRIPLQLEEATVVDPGWSTRPKHSDGIFLAADDADGILTYRAVDSAGTVLWEAQRPQSCTGFTLTTTAEQTIAVLSDLDPEGEGFGTTTVSGYDLHTGQVVWGPVEVTGQHVGPGTVFASSPASQIGEIGPRVVLDPATGKTLFDENTDENLRIIGEYHGVIVVLTNGKLQAYTAQEVAQTPDAAQPLWTIDAAEYGWDPTKIHSPDVVEVDRLEATLIGNTGEGLSLINVNTGQVIATDLTDAIQDPSSKTWVTLGEKIAGYDPTGQEYFRGPGEDLHFHGVGSAVVYLQNADGNVEPRNVVTGEVVRAYEPNVEGAPAVPIFISPSGAGVLHIENGYILATTL